MGLAEIRGFGALRFTARAGDIEELVCPPYDIISEGQREAYLARNAHNIIRLELPREGEEPYKAAGETLRQWLAEDVLACDREDGVYIYEEAFTAQGREASVKGIVCRVRLEPFDAGVVLPHEETLSKAKTDRFNLMCATGCNFSSIYSLYFDREQRVYPRIEALSKDAPEMDFDGGDGVRHRVWRVTDKDEVAAVCAGFADKKLYIADGHHRYETALNYRERLKSQGVVTDDKHPANYVMMTLVNMEHPGLVVLPTHRIVRGLPDFDAHGLLAGCGEYFDVEDVDAARAEARLSAHMRAGEKAVALLYKGGARVLVLRDAGVMGRLLPEGSPAYRQLDVNILHTLILERLLGIDRENMASQRNLIYTRDAREAAEAVESGGADCAFLLNPTRVSEIADVAGAGEKMPQKSTYFYPKLITGHVMNKML